ncbi:YtcA family lipoprotein [Terracidiphilus sp.]|uniref:YtcA family lipoprotein n=1 Tax=Terracidiphilus sp. TaxID=1964191 RepID=UPI003C24B247
MKQARNIPALLLALPPVLLLAGCSHAPTFNILGSFFPSWLLCLIVGICVAALVHWLLTRYKLEKLIAWPVLIYPCLAAFFSFFLWLIFFS